EVPKPFSGVRSCLHLGHAGRRGATRPGVVDLPLRDGWPLLSASPIPYSRGSRTPKGMDRGDMDEVLAAFVDAARRAGAFDVLELNMAQGYLLASFLSPLTNVRDDEYGGSPEGRMRFPL